MKSIFRKIAFVLALAMVVTMFPVMNASAANNGNKYARTKDATLYVGGDANGDYEGCWAAQTKTKTWMKEEGYKSSYKTSDDSVVTVSKYGYVEAVSVGKAEITATFSKKGEEDIVETFNVTVKKNAVSIALDKESQDALSAGLTAGDKVTLKAVQTDADGSNEGITDTVKFYCASKEDKEIIELNKDTGELTALKDGKATVVVQSCQYEYDRETKKYKTTVAAKAEYPVEVKEAGLVSAVQKTLNVFEVTTGTAEVAKAIVDAYGSATADNSRLVVDRRISDKLTIKDLAIAKMEIKSDVAPNVIVVTLAAPIEAASAYVVKYNEMSVEFVGVEAKPASIEITTTEATFGVETPVGIVIRTIEGVDITESQEGKYWLETGESADYYLDTTNRTILFWEEGKSATVTAVYDMGWDEEKGVKIEDLKDTKIIRSVKEATTAINLIDGFAVTAEPKNNDDDVKKLEFKQGVINLAVGDAQYLYAKYSTTKDKKEDAYLTQNNAADFEIKSSNDNVLSVSGNVLYPQNAGSASVTIKKGNQTIGVAYVSVVATRYLSTMDVQISKRNLSDADNDQIKVTVKAKDQLGGDITPNVTATTSNACVLATATNNEVILTAGSGMTQGTVTIKLEVSYGGVKRPYQFGISVKHVDPASQEDGYAVTVSQNELDTKLNSGKHTTDINIETLKGGFHLGTYSGVITPINSLGEIGKVGNTYTNGMYIQVSKGSDYFKTSMVGNQFQALVSGTAVTTSGAAVSVAAPSGTYLVRVYQVKNGAAPSIVGSTTFTVKDSTSLAAEVTGTTVVGTVTEANASALTACINLKVDGTVTAWGAAKDDISYNLVGCKLSNTSAQNSYFVRAIVVEASYDGKNVRYEVPVNRLFQN